MSSEIKETYLRIGNRIDLQNSKRGRSQRPASVQAGFGCRLEAQYAPVLMVESGPAQGLNMQWGVNTSHTAGDDNNGERVFSGTGTYSKLSSRGLNETENSPATGN